MTQPAAAPSRSLRHLQLASIFEGVTLLTLLGVAVPLKHLAGLPQAVAVMGPVHGLAFLAYLWMTMNVAAGNNWKSSELTRVLGAAFVPFGFISTLRFIRKQQPVAGSASAS